jgi:hypothetical protein
MNLFFVEGIEGTTVKSQGRKTVSLHPRISDVYYDVYYGVR